MKFNMKLAQRFQKSNSFKMWTEAYYPLSSPEASGSGELNFYSTEHNEVSTGYIG